MRKPATLLDEAALYQYAVRALGRQMRTVAELKRLMNRRVEPGDLGEIKVAAVVAGFSFSIITKLLKTWDIDCGEMVLEDDSNSSNTD